MRKETAAKINAAKSASRDYRDGPTNTAERFIFLWDSKQYDAKCVGKIDPKTMDKLIEIGLWVRGGFSCNGKTERFYPTESGHD